MRIAVGADHAGYALKELIARDLDVHGHVVIDKGTFNEDPVDYPDFAEAVARSVASAEAERGVLVCGSGVGASVAANKVRGVRCAICHDIYSAHQGVEHDDMNVLALGSRVIGPDVAVELVRAFVAATFSGEERHLRRLNKVLAIEAQLAEEEGVNG